MSHARRPPPSPPLPPRPRAAGRTYVVLAIGDAAPGHAFAEPLGTVVAGHRRAAKDAARSRYPQVAAEQLRAVAAGAAPAGLLLRALAADAGPAGRAA